MRRENSFFMRLKGVSLIIRLSMRHLCCKKMCAVEAEKSHIGGGVCRLVQSGVGTEEGWTHRWKVGMPELQEGTGMQAEEFWISHLIPNSNGFREWSMTQVVCRSTIFVFWRLPPKMFQHRTLAAILAAKPVECRHSRTLHPRVSAAALIVNHKQPRVIAPAVVPSLRQQQLSQRPSIPNRRRLSKPPFCELPTHVEFDRLRLPPRAPASHKTEQDETYYRE